MIQEIKERLDILDVVSGRVELRKAGSLYKGLCPFHEEKTPSFMVDPRKQRFRCYGCDAHGDVIDFLGMTRNLDSKESICLAADLAGVRLEYPQSREERERMRKETRARRERQRLRKRYHDFSHKIEQALPKTSDPELISAWDCAFRAKESMDERCWKDGGPSTQAEAEEYIAELKVWFLRWNKLLTEMNGDQIMEVENEQSA